MSTKKQAAEGAAETYEVVVDNLVGHPKGSVVTETDFAAWPGRFGRIVARGAVVPTKAAKPAQTEE